MRFAVRRISDLEMRDLLPSPHHCTELGGVPTSRLTSLSKPLLANLFPLI
jgi:hypothetical protein